MTTAADLQILIDDVLQREHKLSDWESGFMDSIGDQLVRRGQLSEKQEATLTKIWEKATEI